MHIEELKEENVRQFHFDDEDYPAPHLLTQESKKLLGITVGTSTESMLAAVFNQSSALGINSCFETKMVSTKAQKSVASYTQSQFKRFGLTVRVDIAEVFANISSTIANTMKLDREEFLKYLTFQTMLATIPRCPEIGKRMVGMKNRRANENANYYVRAGAYIMSAYTRHFKELPSEQLFAAIYDWLLIANFSSKYGSDKDIRVAVGVIEKNGEEEFLRYTKAVTKNDPTRILRAGHLVELIKMSDESIDEAIETLASMPASAVKSLVSLTLPNHGAWE